MQNWDLQFNNNYEKLDAVQEYFNLKDHIEELNREMEKLGQTIEELRPKADAFDKLMNTDGTFPIEVTGKMLGYGRIQFFKLLREKDLLFKNEEHVNLPYQEYINKGYFKVIPISFTDKQGIEHIRYKTVVTGKGLGFINCLFGKTA